MSAAALDRAFVRHVLDNYPYLMRHFEAEASHAALIMAHAAVLKSIAGSQRLRQAAANISSEASAFLALGMDSCHERIVRRIVEQHSSELWLNECPACGVLARTSRAQACRNCDEKWFGTPAYEWHIVKRTLDRGTGGDRVICRQVPNLGLLVCVADGTGNSSQGSVAAEALLQRVKNAPWPPEVNEWDLQELLLDVDQELYASGGETTAVLAVFRENDVIAAAAGDTRIHGLLDGATWTLPAPRTRYRIGSGQADVVVAQRKTHFPIAIATDGAMACLGTHDLLEQLRKSDGRRSAYSWAANRIDARILQVGDDSTCVLVHPSTNR